MTPLVRTRIALGLALASALMIALAVPAIWLERVVLDTDGWVQTVGPLASDAAIRESIARTASDATVSALDTRDRLDGLLPELLEGLVPLLDDAVETTVRTRVERAVDSPAFARIWVDLNRTAHTAFLVALQGRDGAVSVRDGRVSLETRVIAESVRAALIEREVPFVERLSLDRVDGRVTLFEAEFLATAAPMVAGIRRAAVWLPWLAAATAAAALWIAPDRRRATLWLGVGVAVFGLLPFMAVYLSRFPSIVAIGRLGFVSQLAAQALYDAVFASLREMGRVVTATGLLVWAGAVLWGPSGIGAVRRPAAPAAAPAEPAAAPAEQPAAPATAFVRRHRGALLAAGLIGGVGGVLMLPPDAPVSSLAWIAAGVALWLLGVVWVERVTPQAV